MAKVSRKVNEALNRLQQHSTTSNFSYILSPSKSLSPYYKHSNPLLFISPTRTYSSSPSSSSSSGGFSNWKNFISQNTQIPSNVKRFFQTTKINNMSLSTSLLKKHSSSNFTTNFTNNFPKTNVNVVDKPLSAVRSVFSRYKQAVGLQIEAFWKRNYLVLVGVVGVGVCMLLWKIMFGIANTFVGLSEGMAKYGFLALSSAIVTLAGLYIRSRFTINPDRVYRIAMRKLNTSAGILEVMGAPLSGTDVRAYVMSGGGITLKNFKPKLGGKRCFLIFPIRGSERKGLVSVEVKKKKGQYDMKLLAIDVPMTTGPDQRFFLIGDEEEYKVGGGLISELRDPIVKAMAAEKEFEALDQKEEEEDEERELEEAERKNREELQKLEKDSP
ncbi:hypothetical protein AQUCO_01600422v1 [Aquilegia coerulea]|uniref:Uncharacterized protein n=1 Tax=Aquilegia coerulea TaxID=218851 RepID=A0A2G5DRI7_AQUCA|nr:hypothetical protein AQUCO_01600422v1 [Aquilegia coerulea]